MLLGYADIQGDLLPINNDENFHKAVSSANPLLRIIITKKGKTGYCPATDCGPVFLIFSSSEGADGSGRCVCKVFVAPAWSFQKERLLMKLSSKWRQANAVTLISLSSGCRHSSPPPSKTPPAASKHLFFHLNFFNAALVIFYICGPHLLNRTREKDLSTLALWGLFLYPQWVFITVWGSEGVGCVKFKENCDSQPELHKWKSVDVLIKGS